MFAVVAAWCAPPPDTEQLIPAPIAEYAVAVIEPADEILDALLQMENPTGDCSHVGLSGEHGCFQYMPGTWSAYSKEILGAETVLTEDTERRVTRAKVQGWLDEGYTARDIFLTWNQGHAGKCRRGTNQHGVNFDSCAYADAAVRLLDSLSMPLDE